jgi:hypothetical protein
VQDASGIHVDDDGSVFVGKRRTDKSKGKKKAADQGCGA